jgi:hypothetical protein
MKKALLVLLMTIAISPVFAQAPGFTFGPKIGATLSKYHSDVDLIKEEVRNTLHWGIFARIGQSVYIQPELLFMDKSGLLINTDAPASEQVIKLRTIDVPLLVGVRIANLKVANVRAFAGPVASMAINREVETQNWEQGLTEDDIRQANWALQFGAGVDLLIFTIDVRYERGMGDYSKITAETLKNNLVTVSLGWKIL